MAGSPAAKSRSGATASSNAAASAAMPSPVLAETSVERTCPVDDGEPERKSDLFETRIEGFDPLISSKAVVACSSVFSVPSSTNRTSEAFSNCWLETSMAMDSIGCSVFLSPAVSTNRIGTPSRRMSSSIASRVVPGISAMMTRFLPTRELNKLLFPTFGGPVSTTRGGLHRISPRRGGVSSL